MSDEERILQVGLISSQPRYREWAVNAISRMPGFQVMRIANSLSQMNPQKIDLILMEEGGGSQVELVQFMERYAIRGGIFITGSDAINARFALSSSHPVGYLADTATLTQFLAVLQAVAAGNHVLPASGNVLAESTIGPEPLSSREMEVLSLIVAGMTNCQISAALRISGNTVKYHLTNIYGKLGVTHRTEAIRAAIAAGLVTF